MFPIPCEYFNPILLYKETMHFSILFSATYVTIV